MEVSKLVFCVFCLILTICPVTHHGPFSMILDSFGYFHTPWRWSTKPFTKRFSRCGGKCTCISCFCLILTICPVTHYSPFSMILATFGYLHTMWRCSRKPFMKRLSRCGGKWICILCFLPYTHHLPSHSPWSVSHDLRLFWIPSHSVKMLHKTVHETVEPLWR